MSDESVRDALKQMGLLSEHETALETIPPYAAKMEEFIRDRLNARTSTSSKKRQTLDSMAKEANEEFTQMRLGLPDDEIGRRSLEELIAALETRLRRLGAPEFIIEDDEGNGVTLRGAIGSLGLWAKAIRGIQNFAAMKRIEADLANQCERIALEIFERGKKEAWRD